MLLCKNANKLPPVILLIGPTATGKTDLAIEFAKHLPSEIISVDSAMVYRGLDIGTGKPTPAQLTTTPHHLIDIRHPSEPYSAAEFCRDALKCVADIRARNRIPILVGGTMLYFRSLLQGLSPLPSADPHLRARLLREAENASWQVLHERLSLLDPVAASRIHPNDPQRIQRALEIYEVTHNNTQPQSQPLFQTQTIFDVLKEEEDPALHIFIVLPRDRRLLHERIRLRFHQMLEQGFMTEVQNLHQQVQTGILHLALPALRAVGYRQALHYFAGEYPYDETIERVLAATRQLAKRQITWLRGLFHLTADNLVMFKDSQRAGDTAMVAQIQQTPYSDAVVPQPIHVLDIENNHSDSLQTMIHCIT